MARYFLDNVVEVMQESCGLVVLGLSYEQKDDGEHP